jgi:aspartyl aminopeptidase
LKIKDGCQPPHFQFFIFHFQLYKDFTMDFANDLMSYLDRSPTMFQATAESVRRLMAAGFTPLDETDSWKLSPGGRHFVVRNNTAVAAFVLPKALPKAPVFRIAGAHTDSPCLKVKADSESVAAGCIRVAVEVYGGPINSTWLDRPLSLAGRAIVRGVNGRGEVRLVNLQKPVAVIPNLAIHLNRDVNTAFEYNKQNHLPLVLGNASDAKARTLRPLVAAALGLKDPEAILELDLYAYDCQPAQRVGAAGEFVCSGRLDNLAACHAILAALPKAEPAKGSIALAILFDNEEIGSQTPMGADSSFLKTLLERIVLGCGGGREALLQSLAGSFLISNDAAHAIHPNFTDKHDGAYAPTVNGGPVIKLNANFRYATTADTAAVFADLCRQAKVPCQRLVNRSDLPAGSTIGPMTSASLGIRGVDVGIPMWAMHSCRETAGTRDHAAMRDVLKLFFTGPLP